jgi:parvulin-like peptidyl-prolyl isomerase
MSIFAAKAAKIDIPRFRSGIIPAMVPIKHIFLILAVVVVLTACNQATPTNPAPTSPTRSPSQPTATTVISLTPTVTVIPPTQTPIPVPSVAKVNNEAIPQAEYDAELQRMQAALKELGKEMSPQDQKQTVLQDLIEQVLLAQAATQAGYTLSDADLQKHVDQIIAKNGGVKSFVDWLQNNFYTETSFRSALRRSLTAAWQRDQIIAKVPATAEQVHARQILVLNEDVANRMFKQLQAGADFTTLATQVDPLTGGDLSWFPRGYLFLPEIEKAAFDLQPGKYSPIIKTAYGYHIVYVIERDPDRPLSSDARLQTQRAFLKNWLKERRTQSQIEMVGSAQ